MTLDHKIFENEAQVLEFYNQDKEQNQVIIFENTVYNVKEYMGQHPGGGDQIFKLIGRRIDEDFEDAEHSKSARKIFKDLPIVGKIETAGQEKSEKVKGFEGMGGLESKVSEKINFDYNKGIIY